MYAGRARAIERMLDPSVREPMIVTCLSNGSAFAMGIM
jgi:hypothetical protein